MRIGIPKERLPNETRVAATPKTVEQLLKLGFSVAIESGAGQLASFDDKAFAQAGADIVDGNAIWQSEIILKVNAPEEEEIALLNPGTTLVSFIWPAQNPGLMEKLAERKVTVMAMDSVPRISRAQSLDALSSMANIAGYRAIVEAAHEFGRFFTGQITAAGKVPPAKVMVIGAGVAGLAAIGAANSLGAIVRAFDTRPEVKEQVQSMGAEFLELDFKEEAGSRRWLRQSDVRGVYQSGNGALCRPGQRSRYHCYHRVDSGQTCAEADYPRYGRFYEGRQRDCRPGRAEWR